MQVVRYTEADKDVWNALVETSCNGTFLFHRSFMDYHKDRFEDASLMFFNKGKIKGILPASIKGDCVSSHGGLTYGGLVWDKRTSSQEVGDMLNDALDYYAGEFHARSLYYTPVPYIYHTYPASADLYFLFQRGGRQIHSKLSSAIDLTAPIPFSSLRRRMISKARKKGLDINFVPEKGGWIQYWDILKDILRKRHNRIPVHSLDEILLLKDRFPSNIKLVTVEDNGEMVAGTVLFLCNQVIHTQYIASNDKGCEEGALDFLFQNLIQSPLYSSYRYLDFGISTEEEGKILNQGLLFQKEGFGGRGVCYNDYLIQL